MRATAHPFRIGDERGNASDQRHAGVSAHSSHQARSHSDMQLGTLPMAGGVPRANDSGMNNDCNDDESGLTLLELTTALLVLALVSFYSVPSMTRWKERLILDQAVNGAVAAIRWSRALAIVEHQRMRLCALDTAELCGPFAAGQSRWRVAPELLPTDVRHRFSLPPGYSIVGPDSRPGILFQTDGFTPGSNLTLKVCDAENAWRRTIVISNSGRARLETPAAGAVC